MGLNGVKWAILGVLDDFWPQTVFYRTFVQIYQLHNAFDAIQVLFTNMNTRFYKVLSPRSDVI